jgi:ABC-type antimicrobial peptide transport system permease subunit
MPKEDNLIEITENLQRDLEETRKEVESALAVSLATTVVGTVVGAIAYLSSPEVYGPIKDYLTNMF